MCPSVPHLGYATAVRYFEFVLFNTLPIAIEIPIYSNRTVNLLGPAKILMMVNNSIGHIVIFMISRYHC